MTVGATGGGPCHTTFTPIRPRASRHAFAIAHRDRSSAISIPNAHSPLIAPPGGAWRHDDKETADLAVRALAAACAAGHGQTPTRPTRPADGNGVTPRPVRAEWPSAP